MFKTPEPLFFYRSDKFAILNETGLRVAMERIDPQNEHY